MMENRIILNVAMNGPAAVVSCVAIAGVVALGLYMVNKGYRIKADSINFTPCES